MEKIHSKITGELLHVICRKEEISLRREEFGDSEQVLQVATIVLKEGEGVPPHKHLINKRNTDKTQEFVSVIVGEIIVEFYDVNNSLIIKTTLKEGDSYSSYGGGHGLIASEEGTKLYEIKNGPYNGKEKDKTNLF